MYKICFFVPMEHAEAVKSAMFDAGAGRIGRYDCCCWQVEGTGQFRPLPGSTPFIGTAGHLERVRELKIEMVCEDDRLPDSVAALRSAHPYETPAYEYWKIQDSDV